MRFIRLILSLALAAVILFLFVALVANGVSLFAPQTTRNQFRQVLQTFQPQPHESITPQLLPSLQIISPAAGTTLKVNDTIYIKTQSSSLQAQSITIAYDGKTVCMKQNSTDSCQLKLTQAGTHRLSALGTSIKGALRDDVLITVTSP